jgi:hypothetical protein
MPFDNVGAFAAGFVAGWTGRSVAGSTREGLVRLVVLGHELKAEVARAIGERFEWLEDLLAEGRMRYEEERGQPPDYDEDAAPDVKSERAA